MLGSDFRLLKKYGRETRNFDLAVWERERETFVLVASYPKFAQNPAMRWYLVDTDDNLFVKASSYDRIWGIGYTVYAIPAPQPRLWRSLNWLAKAPQNVKRLLRNRAPPPTRPQPRSSQGTPPSRTNIQN